MKMGEPPIAGEIDPFFGGIRFPSKCFAASHLLYFAKVVAISNMWSFQISTDWPINPHMQQKQRFEEK